MRYVMHKTLVFLFFLSFSTVMHPVFAAYMPMVTGGAYVMAPVKSYHEQRFVSVIPQQKDFSCGSAALATLLKFHYGQDVTEGKVLKAMYDVGDQEKIRNQGFSLLDMKHYLKEEGIEANGYNASLDKLVQVGIPAIVLINTRGYLHFVVVKGVDKKMVLVGDPALGKRIIDREEFESMWNGVLFVIDDDKQVGRTAFNQKEQWMLRNKPPMSMALSNQMLSNFTTFTALTPNYFN